MVGCSILTKMLVLGKSERKIANDNFQQQKSNITTNNNVEKVLVLKPIVCDTSDDSSDDGVDLSNIRNNYNNHRVELTNARYESSNISNDSSNDRVDVGNIRKDSSNDSDDDSDLETEYCEPAIEVVTLRNTKTNRSVRDIGVQTKCCKIDISNLRKKKKSLQEQVRRRDVIIKKLQRNLLKMKAESMKAESHNKEKNVINLICVHDIDEV